MQATAASVTAGSTNYRRTQLVALVTLRTLVGWHFFYEGLAKIVNPYWTSAGYLAESKWWFSKLFVSLAANPTPLGVVDFVNKWGLLLIGLGLLLGCLTRVATVGGMVLLFLYYIAAPPFVGLSYGIPAEGAYLVVNKVLIELAALWVLLVFPTGRIIGLDRLIFWNRASGDTLRLAEDTR
ncbi:MAG: DoxX family membrane protein [Gemmatimonadota bacterium]|nr:MAG: DoxX family membrane protein [Gemmatimonadota bacterium]